MLAIGMFVRYTHTGTIGKVIDIKEFDGKTWAQLDNELYYDIDHLEPISEFEFLEIRAKETSKKMDERLKKLLEKEEIEFKEDLCGAG
ncbi:MAG: DUF2098 domain-containing protein [archaeon]|nr:DUF2098 domain-containing protein [archaeon]MCP8315128.1 DUF2098 domain-containing protein [archaeon]MCP8320029.1 DUF2098 domain-containing protein [archaeon]